MNRFDLLIIGGGINGAAIARDAAGRGLKVLLVEKDDLASHTSSASSKLVHGGLRYLERREFRLVRESLAEREVLLATAPHIVRPLRFILPDPPGGRPRWLIRAGLALYDLLAGRGSLPRSRRLKTDVPEAAPLRGDGGYGLFEYHDAWVDDARLVVLNALDAAERGAEIATRCALVSARREDGSWIARLSDGREVAAKMLVNATGPFVVQVLARLGLQTRSRVRLVKGSHIVVPALYAGGHGYILQQPDGRVVFALPFGEHTMIGTTDVPVDQPDAAPPSAEEVAYLCEAANRFFRAQTTPLDVLWSFAGVRALHDDGSVSAKDVTRDYHLELDADGAPVLSVFGGKITTARALASEVLDRLRVGGLKFTRTTPLPGGDVDHAFNVFLMKLAEGFPAALLMRLATAYGTRLAPLLGGATRADQMGRNFGAGLYEAELRYLHAQEFARTAEDVLWRRTKLGLEMDAQEVAAVEKFISGDLSVRHRPTPSPRA